MPAADSTPFAVRWIDAEEVARRRSALLNLAVRAKGSWGYGEDLLRAFEATMHSSLDRPGLAFVLAESGSTLAGYASLDAAGNAAWLEDLWVDPAWQQRGIGAALLSAVMSEAARRGARVLECESDPNAEPFYVARGAQRIAMNPSTLDARRMIPTVRWILSAGPPPIR